MPDVLSLVELERAGIVLAMEQYGPRRKREAAAALGISLKCLYDKLGKYGMTEYLRASRPRSAPA